MSIGSGTSISWNFSAIDWDSHHFYDCSGQKIERSINPLIIGDNVAIQPNVFIPKGLSIGDNAVIGSNTVLRSDVPPNCLAYSDHKLKVKDNVTSGFKFYSGI